MNTLSTELRAALLMFVTHEARLADESEYQAWQDLWAEDGVYWVPRNDGDYSPDKQVSHLYDNYRRIQTRVAQLKTGFRYSQVPVSRMRRLMSNHEYFAEADGRFRVEANFFLPEFSVQAVHDFRLWSGRVTYVVSERGDSYQMHLKKVVLVNADEPIPTLAFLI